MNEVKVRVAKERLYEECVMKKYTEALGRAWRRVKDDMDVDDNVNNMSEVFGDVVNRVTEEV